MTRRNYPNHRRPPIAHTVNQHSRDGHSVKSYNRGSGARTNSKRLTRVKGRNVDRPLDPTLGDNAEAFTVTLKYKNGSFEIIHVIAPKGNYQKAISEALEERSQYKKYPVEVNVKDPSLGEIIGFIRKGVGTGLKYVKKGIVKASPHVKSGIKRGAKGLGRGIKRGAVSIAGSVKASRQNAEAKRLVNHSYSEDPGVRATARKKLKQKYPEVYDNCDFSSRSTRSELSRRQRIRTQEDKRKKKRSKQIKEFFS